MKILDIIYSTITKIIPDKLYLKRIFYRTLWYKLNLKNPQTLNEKLQRLKIYDRKPEYTQMVDKYLAKKYIADIVWEKYLIPTLWIYNTFDEIDFDKLPNQFVLKCTHDSWTIVVCKDKKNFDIQAAKKKINERLKVNYYYLWREWPYKNVKPRIIAEKYMVDESWIELKDYKIFCFNGKAEYVEVDFNRAIKHKLNTYDFDWNPLNFWDKSENDYSANITKPKKLQEMKELAEKISRNMKFLRVDFYSIDNDIYVWELTLHPWAWLIQFNPKEVDLKYGKLLNLTIDTKISDRVNSVSQSLTRKLFNMAKNYDDVIDLTLWDPDLPTPVQIKEAAKMAIDNNYSHYSPNAWLIASREAVAKNILKVRDIEASSEDEIAITVWGMEWLYLSLISLVNPWDEVILFSPYYVNYLQMIKSCWGSPIIIDSYTEKWLQIDKDILEKNITSKTKVIIVNSPNNPTWDAYKKQDLEIIFNIAVEHDLIIISDEVYHSLLFDELKHESVLQFKWAKERTILIDSLSKEFCMTWYRIWYVYWPRSIIKEIVKMQENVAACAPVASQYALIEWYTNNISDKKLILEEFQKRRDFVYDKIKNIKNLKCVKPKGTFYLFLDISKTWLDSQSFAYNFLEKKHVAVVPWEAYWEKYKKYVRIAFTKDNKTLEKALNLLEEYVNEI